MTRRRWLRWCQELLFGRFANAPRPRRQPDRHRPLAVEELGPRWLPDATDPFLSALPLGLNGPALVGSLNPAPTYYAFSVTESGRLVTELTPAAGAARLTLWSGDSAVLMQSDGSGGTTGRIDLHLAGSVAGTTYYLEVERLSGAAESFTLEADYAPATPPFEPLQARGILWGHPADLNRDGIADMAIANFSSNEVFVLIGRGDGTFAPAATYTVGSVPNDVIAADLNGDHIQDLVSANFDGSLSVLIGRGDGTFADQMRIELGVNPSALAAGDFDGDGQTDLAVADFGTGQTYVLLGQGGATFATPVVYAVGDGPYELIAGDFNGDLRTDLAIANYNDGTVSVLLGNTGGTFMPKEVVAVGETPYGMALADFNRDGHLDLATANYNTNDVSVLLGRGDGTFTVGSVATGVGPYAVVTGDFNGDDNPDLAVTNFSDGTLSVIAGRGDGTFDPQSVIRVGASPAMIAVADFNRDDRIDLAHGDYTGHVSIDLGRGDGTFLIPEQPVPGGSSYSITTGDFNGDGRLDLATANYNTSDVQIFLGRQDGTFRAGGRYSTGSDSIEVVAADLNFDGVLDLVTSNYSTSNVSVLLGRGDGSFGAPTFFSTGNIPYRAVVNDFNGDDIPDIATPNLGSDSVSILLGRGDGTFADPLDFAVGASPIALRAGDFNGDGELDLVAANSESDSLSVLFGRGDGTFGDEVQLATGDRPMSVTVGDFNGDGILDLAGANVNTGSVSVFLGQSGGTFLPRVDFAAGLAPDQIRAVDMNSDGHLDLIALSARDNRLRVFFGQGDATFQAGELVAPGTTPEWSVVGDFDGDGSVDLVTCNFGSSDFTVLLNSGDGTFRQQSQTPLPLGSVALARGDLNHDGFSDLVTADYTAGTVSVRLGRGDGTFSDPVALAVGAGPAAVALTDVNRDGRLDIVVANSLDGTVNVQFGIGDGTFRNALTMPVGITPTAIAAGDFNGDGLNDAVVADYSSGEVIVLLNGGYALPTLSRYAVGQGPSAVSLADLNGDGVSDIVVANSLSRDVTVLLGSSDGTFQTLTATPVAGAPVAIAIGDVDGDGRIDVVTANQGDGSVSILLGRGDGTFQAPTRLTAGSAPVSVTIRDFNGDSRADLAVADFNTNAIQILLGRGDGTFQLHTSVTVGNYPATVVTGDFNNDGRFDLVAANALGTITSAVLGLGTGEFTEAGSTIPLVQSPPLVADFNYDGIPDVVSLQQNGTILFRPGRGDGNTAFGSPVVINADPMWAARSLTMGTGLGTTVLVAVNARTNMASFYAWAGNGFARIFSGDLGTDIPSAVVVGDVNADGLSDFVVGSATSGNVYIGLQRQNEDLSERDWDLQINAGAEFANLALADMNADGWSDLVFTESSAGAVGILLNDPITSFSSRLRFRAGTGLIAAQETGGSLRLESRDLPIAVVTGNFDGDETQDLAVLNRGARQVTILRGDGHGGVLNPDPLLSLSTGRDPISLAKGDFNGDGLSDLVVLNTCDEDLSILLQNAGGGFTEVLSRDFNGRMARPSAGSEPVGVSVFDVNRDGIADVVVGDPEGDVLTLLGNGDGTFRPYERLDFRVALAVGDQNKDGTHEIAFASRTTDRISLQADDGSRTFVQDRSDGVRNPHAIRFADLNSDGVADLIATNAGANSVLVYLGIREAEFGPAHRFFVGTQPGGITVGDLNDDGIPDLVIANEGSDDVSILFGHGHGANWTMTPGPRLQAGAGPTNTVIRDVTGDGIIDILVANGGSNSVYLLPGVGAGFFDDQRPVVFHTGDRPVQLFIGDFDTQVGLDLVTVNATSNDITVFSGLRTSSTIATAGVGAVQAVAGDFTGSGSLSLFVVSQDGRFTLLQQGADGFGVAEVFDSGLAHISDMGLASIGGGSLDVYVTLEGEDVAVPISFAFTLSGPGGPGLDPWDPAPDPSSPDNGPPNIPDSGLGGDGGSPVAFPRGGSEDGAPTGEFRTDSTPLFVTDFSAYAGGPLELLATLELGSPGVNGAEVLGSDFASLVQLSSLWEWYINETAEEDNGEAATGGNGTDDSQVRDRNGFITGATEAPLLDYLVQSPKAAKQQPGIVFPSPLEVFGAEGHLRVEQLLATADLGTGSAIASGSQIPLEGGPEGESPADELAVVEQVLCWEVLGAAALSSVLVYIALRRPTWGRRQPILPSLNVRGNEGDRCERDGHLPS